MTVRRLVRLLFDSWLYNIRVSLPFVACGVCNSVESQILTDILVLNTSPSYSYEDMHSHLPFLETTYLNRLQLQLMRCYRNPGMGFLVPNNTKVKKNHKLNIQKRKN